MSGLVPTPLPGCSESLRPMIELAVTTWFAQLPNRTWPVADDWLKVGNQSAASLVGYTPEKVVGP